MVDAEGIIAIPILIALALFFIWIFWFGGLETVLCEWLSLRSFSACS